VAQSELPVETLHFLAAHIRSIEQLETLLLLHGAPDRLWTAEEVYRIVRSTMRSVTETLEQLSRQGLVQRTGEGVTATYQFKPGSDQLKSDVKTLSRLYAERRVKIIEAIYSEGRSELDEFARAFRLRKDPHA